MTELEKQLLDAAKEAFEAGSDGDWQSARKALSAAIAAAEAAQPVGPGLYAILYRNNWDGEGDTYHLLAECKDGKWYAEDSGKELLQYEGDAILRAWPLTGDKAQQPASAQPVAVPEDVIASVERSLTEAWRLGQAMYQYASRNSGKAMTMAQETQNEFNQVKERVRAMLSAAKPEGGE